MFAVRPDSTLKWIYSGISSFYIGAPAIGGDGTVYVSNKALNTDGTIKWTYPVGGSDRTSAAIGPDGTIYFVDDGYYMLRAFTPGGILKWSHAGCGAKSSPAVAADGTIYIGGNGLVAINPDGSVRWRNTQCSVESSVAVAPDGTVYCAALDGYVYAVRAHAPLANSSWPMAHHDPKHTGRAQ